MCDHGLYIWVMYILDIAYVYHIYPYIIYIYMYKYILYYDTGYSYAPLVCQL